MGLFLKNTWTIIICCNVIKQQNGDNASRKMGKGRKISLYVTIHFNTFFLFLHYILLCRTDRHGG